MPKTLKMGMKLRLAALALRLGDRLSMRELLGEEDVVRDTIDGKRLLAEGEQIGERKGELRLLERQLRERLGDGAEAFLTRLASCDVDLIEQAGVLVAKQGLSDQQLVAALHELLPSS